VGEVSLTVPSLVKGAGLGLGGSLVAGMVPAREAGGVEPRAALSRADLEMRAGAGARTALLGGVLLAGAGTLVLAVPIRSLVAGFTGLFLVVVGLALTTPALMRGLALGLGGTVVVGRFLPARLAVQGVAAALSRTGVAAAALMLAVATTVGVGVMVASFRASVDDWLGRFLRADYYLSLPASSGTEAGAAMDLELARGVSALPGVRHVSHVRHVTLTTSSGLQQLAVFQLNPEARDGFQFIKQIDNEDIWRSFEEGDVVLVTESYAYLHQVETGDAVSLRTDRGPRPFTIIGVYRDYGSDRGLVALSRDTYGRHWPRDGAVNGIGVYAGPAIDEDRLRMQVAELAGPDRQVELVANRAIREASLAVFDRTFTITEVLRLLAGIIAFIGVFSALLAIQLERTRELGVLKAVGVTPGQLRGIVLGETALVGAVAGLYAVPVGTILALLLIEVINRRSFGWGMGLTLDGGVFLSGIVMAVSAALLAGIFPAARMARIQPAEALRSE
jgi:putative ABC transport system permease protein